LAYGCGDWDELSAVVGSKAQGREHLTDAPPHPSLLADAANRNDIEAVQRILRQESCTHHDLDRALARAVFCFAERRAIAELLLEHGADPDGQNGSAYGPIALVTGECLDPNGMQVLYDHGADLAFPPLTTKYGDVCMLSSVLGAKQRGTNTTKHVGIDFRLRIGAPLPVGMSPAVLAIHRGDVVELEQALERNPSLAIRAIPDLAYGNTSLTMNCASPAIRTVLAGTMFLF